MKTTTTLEKMDIQMAIAAYVKDKTGQSVDPRQIRMSYHRGDQREPDSWTATVPHTESSSIG